MSFNFKKSNKFLLILLFQLILLSVSILSCTVSFIPGEEPAYLLLQNRFGIHGLFWEVVVFLILYILLRVCIVLEPNILRIVTFWMYTISGIFIACHLASILICSGHQHKDDDALCLDSSPSVIRGQNAIYISAPLFVLSFLMVHMSNCYHRYYYADISLNYNDTNGIVWDAILQNALFIIFAACISVCIIDDITWDWKYAYAFLFTAGITTYINGFSTFIFMTTTTGKNDTHDMILQEDYWTVAALVFLQPLLFVEDTIKFCLTN